MFAKFLDVSNNTVTRLTYLIVLIFTVLKLYSACDEFGQDSTRYNQILIHLQHWTGSSQMNPLHTLGRSGQGRLEQIKIDLWPGQRGSSMKGDQKNWHS